MQIEEGNVLGSILGLRSTDRVCLFYGDFQETRHMQTKDGEVKFRQQRDEDGEWYVTEFLTPDVERWTEVVRMAREIGLSTPVPSWIGPVNAIPDGILQSEAQIMLRRTDTQGWMNLREQFTTIAVGKGDN